MPPAARRLLVIVAHPDDETFGMGSTIAHYAAEGVDVHVVCATRGEEGEIADGSDATPETLGEVREQELRNAAEVLGVKRVYVLGYRDSGMVPVGEVAHPDAFVNASEADLMVKLTRLIRDIRPHVVIAMPQDGGSGHPDHIRISDAATRAFKLAAHPGYIEPGGLTHAPSKLYYFGLSREIMRECMAAAGRKNPETAEIMRESGIREFGLAESEVTTRLDVSGVLEIRRKAIACHASQASPLNALPEDIIPRVLATDTFIRGIPSWNGGDIETDLFAGL